MADPRSFTVKQCGGPYASRSAAVLADSTSSRRDFFNALGKIGDTEILNSVGGGKVGAGLRTLASISNTVRTGSGSLPTILGSTIENGANWVLNQTGMAANVVQAVQAYHPEVANQAWGQAKQIFSHVKSGTFTFSSIPNYLQDLQNLERLSRGIFTPSNTDYASELTPRCAASPYATDLIARSPKYKFLFVVSFIPNSGYTHWGNGSDNPLDTSFVVKRTNRPELKAETQDVNYYNYRSKVITKTAWNDINMTFHEDMTNMATNFYTAYMQAISPITNLEPNAAMIDTLEQQGLDFEGNINVSGISYGGTGSMYAASRGTLADDNKTVFKEITLYHVFENGQWVTVYHFMNPQITTVTMDELDMSVGSEGSEFGLTFSYDSVYIEPRVSMSSLHLESLQRGASYPIKYNGDSGTTISPTSVTSSVFQDLPDELNQITQSSVLSAGTSVVQPTIDTLDQNYSNPMGNIVEV